MYQLYRVAGFVFGDVDFRVVKNLAGYRIGEDESLSNVVKKVVKAFAVKGKLDCVCWLDAFICD